MSANATGQVGQILMGASDNQSWGGISRSYNDSRRSYQASGSTNYWDYLNLNVSHTHTYSGTTSSNNGGNTGAAGTGATGAWSGTTGELAAFDSGNTGSGTSFSILQPYVTCYIWKRTA